jgi:hypothetical protein
MGTCDKHGQFSTLCRACDFDTIEKETEMNTETETKPNQPVPHRWAEVIKAWAEGKEIEYKCAPRPWKTYDQNGSDDNGFSPAFNEPILEWRIKPETKTGWINLYNSYRAGIYAGSTIYKTREAALAGEMTVMRIACIQITYTEGEGL